MQNDDTDDETLLPCPFCGAEPKYGEVLRGFDARTEDGGFPDAACAAGLLCEHAESGIRGAAVSLSGMPEGENFGAEFIECSNPQCGCSTNLLFPAMCGVKNELRDKWNRREHGQPGREIRAEESSSLQRAGSVALCEWQRKLPDESGLWWWWNEDEDSLPIVVDIAYSGCGDNYFAMQGQHGWTRFQNVEDMGGWWRRLHEPERPLPGLLAGKYPHWQFSPKWACLFPAHKPCIHPRTGAIVRWRCHEANVQRCVRAAARPLGLDVTPHHLRHATHCLNAGQNPRAIQQAMGHSQLETTMGYLHAEALSVRSPLDFEPVNIVAMPPERIRSR